LQDDGREGEVYYRVVDLRRSSPATVVLEAFPSDPVNPAGVPDRVVSKFFSSLQDIREHGKIPEDFDLPALEAYRELGIPSRSNLSSVFIENGDSKFPIDHEFDTKIIAAIGPDETVEGSISGMLEKVNLHNTSRFEIFPTIGPRRLICDFSPELRAQVKDGLDQYVRVSGRLRYKHWDKFPYAITTEKMEVYPEENNLPTLWDIRGIAPAATGDLTSEQFVRAIRDAWS